MKFTIALLAASVTQGVELASHHHHHHHHAPHHKHNQLAQHKWWVDGNGGGSEKEDAFEEFGRWSKTTGKFDKLAANPLIPALNKGDRAPTSHSNGFTASLAQ